MMLLAIAEMIVKQNVGNILQEINIIKLRQNSKFSAGVSSCWGYLENWILLPHEQVILLFKWLNIFIL